jgi:hypothetical protein
MTEGQYQTKIIQKLKERFPGCDVLKMDASYRQGFPDLLILYHQYWASLEVKTSPSANVQPNQDYYIDKLSEMSFAAYIYPENEEEVLNALQQAFESPRGTRFP